MRRLLLRDGEADDGAGHDGEVAADGGVGGAHRHPDDAVGQVGDDQRQREAAAVGADR